MIQGDGNRYTQSKRQTDAASGDDNLRTEHRSQGLEISSPAEKQQRTRGPGVTSNHLGINLEA